MKWTTALAGEAIDKALDDLREAGFSDNRVFLLQALMEKTNLNLGFAEESAFAALFLLGAMILREVRTR